MSNIAMSSLCRLILIAAFCLVSVGAQASLQDGLDAFHSGNHSVALEKLMPLADRGDPVAQLYVGRIYMQGLGTKPDYDKAISWTRKAAKQKNAEAEYFLGFMYYYGLGTPQSYPEAVSWYRKAADEGNIKAQSSLGMMSVNGEGTPPDNVQAYKWLRLAELAGDADAGSKLRAVEEKMTEQEIKEGNTLVANWKSKPVAVAKAKQKRKSR